MLAVLLCSCNEASTKTPIMSDSTTTKNPYYSRTDTTKLRLQDSEWKRVLSDEVYYISRNKGTERAFTGKFWDFEGTGTYYCAACGNALFKSDSKFSINKHYRYNHLFKSIAILMEQPDLQCCGNFQRKSDFYCWL